MPLEGRDHSTHCITGWMGPRVGPDILKTSILKLPGIKPWFFSHPAYSLVSKLYVNVTLPWKINRRILMLVHMYAILRTNLSYFF